MSPARSLTGARYARDRGGHVESYFLKANDPRAPRAIWIKTTIYASARAPSGEPHALAEAWAIAFDGDRGHIAVKSSIPFDRARFGARLNGRLSGARSGHRNCWRFAGGISSSMRGASGCRSAGHAARTARPRPGAATASRRYIRVWRVT